MIDLLIQAGQQDLPLARLSDLCWIRTITVAIPKPTSSEAASSAVAERNGRVLISPDFGACINERFKVIKSSQETAA